MQSQIQAQNTREHKKHTITQRCTRWTPQKGLEESLGWLSRRTRAPLDGTTWGRWRNTPAQKVLLVQKCPFYHPVPFINATRQNDVSKKCLVNVFLCLHSPVKIVSPKYIALSIFLCPPPIRLQGGLRRQIWCPDGSSRQVGGWVGPHREGREARVPSRPQERLRWEIRGRRARQERRGVGTPRESGQA